MVPGAREIFGAFPKVHLSLKMQKSEIVNRWWFKTKHGVPYIISRLTTDTSSDQRAALIKLFRIFIGKKYTDGEISIGLKWAGRFAEGIQDTRSTYKEENQLFIKQRNKLYNKKIEPKLRKIYEEREIPLFNAKTHGELKFINEIIDEKDLNDRQEFNDDRRIWVFKFRDANGKLSLNFYSEKKQGRGWRRNRESR